MEKVDDLFLSFSDMEKYNLFVNIIEMKQKETTPAKLLDCMADRKQHITDINIKQVAELLGRSYGSIYNTYMGLISDLNNLLGTKDADLETLFNVEANEYYAYLTKRSYPYQFIDTIVQGKTTSFRDFYTNLGSSKATVLRHLKTMRHFLKERGIRMTYEPMGLVSKNELSVRIALTSLYWRAGSTYTWPFKDTKRQDAIKLVKGAAKDFDFAAQSEGVLSLMALYFMVSYFRIRNGRLVDPKKFHSILHYAFPNLLKEYLEAYPAPELHLDEDQMMEETSGLFLVYSLIPLYSETNKLTVTKFLQKIDYYNQEIADFINTFLDNLPLEEHDALSKTAIDMQVIKANLIAIFIGTVSFDNPKMFLFNTDDQMALNAQPQTNSALYRSLRNTLSHVVMYPKFSQYKPLIDDMLPIFYAVLKPYLVLYRPESTVNVFIAVLPSFFDNSRLEQMLKSMAFVNILDASDDLSTADLMICSSIRSLPADVAPQAAVMTWRTGASSDLFGRLYGLLRQIQLNKEQVPNMAHVDPTRSKES
ncbi:MAG: helix-turn-helix domain-containing protein [Lactobacillus sp.]|jgi:hypothetical protein|nr:helix-turn-helix domain-containing protein [Lactobacillus sp.]